MLEATEKQMPCAPMMTAVLTPITSARELTSGPPELPGLRAASVWITVDQAAALARSERPTALMMPAVTVDQAERVADGDGDLAGLDLLEPPSLAAGSRSLVSALSTAMSVSGSRPHSARQRVWNRQSASSMAEAPTTWLLVSTMPSGDRMVPEPEP